MQQSAIHSFQPRRPPNAEPPTDPTAEVLRAARQLGFAAAGVGSVGDWGNPHAALGEWLAAGFAADMAYMHDPARSHPHGLMPDAQSFVAVALCYPRPADLVPLRRAAGAAPLLSGSVARYAQGQDYHLVIKTKLWELARSAADACATQVRARICVDTAPLLERHAACRAGLGFIGKSAMLIIPGIGTNFLLGALLIDTALTPSPPTPGGCGTCTSCLDACPTKAFVGPNQVDARRCVSYLTIENHGPIAPELRTGVGRRVFGCDVCQDVCPYNASPAPQGYAPELAPEPQRSRVDLLHWLAQTSGDNRRLVRRSAMRRAGRNQLKRNAAVALGNSGDPRAIPALCAALTSELSPLVRAHVAWALGKLGGPDAERSLESAQTQEADPAVQHELQAALLTLRGRRS